MGLNLIVFIISLTLQIYIGNSDKLALYKTAKTENGMVRGRLGGLYYAFLGIPYAAPPVGRNRFTAPMSPAPWYGTMEANKIVQCPQKGKGDENCLVVNVFIPTRPVRLPLPVLVYIHGGFFLFGTGPSSGVEALSRKDLIVVTVNYRVGAMGFLCLGIEEAPGNAGLKDLVAALKWVKNNIEYFGGDSNRITVYGMDAGGAAVELLILSKFSKELFQNAIIESGTATNVWAIDMNPMNTAVDMSNKLNFPNKTNNLYELVEYYQQIPVDKLNLINFEYYNDLTDGKSGFTPCLENKLLDTYALLTEAPINILRKNMFTKVPIMFVFTSLEGLYFKSEEYHKQDYKNKMQNNFLDFLPADLVFETHEIKSEIAKNVKHFYFGNGTVEDNILGYLNYFGDTRILNGLLNSAESHSRDGNPVYLMLFAYKNSANSDDKLFNKLKGAGHGSVSNYAISDKPGKTRYDKLTTDRVTTMISNFVKYGNPTPERTELLPILWPTVQPNNVSCLLLDKEMLIIEEPFWGRKKFWDKIYEKYRRPIKPVDPRLF